MVDLMAGLMADLKPAQKSVRRGALERQGPFRSQVLPTAAW